jgi:hypothetical protein
MFATILLHPMKKLFASLLLSLLALCLFSGCSSGVERIGLQVQLTKLVRTADGSLQATLVVSNPNIGSVNIAESTHELYLDGVAAGTLKIPTPIGLPAQQTSTMTAVFKSHRPVPAGNVSYQVKSVLTMLVIDDDTETFKTSFSGRVTVE